MHRVDFHSRYGAWLSPRVSALLRPRRDWNARLSAGAGVFAPTPLTEETEATGLSRLLPIGSLGVERARGAAADVGGRIGPAEVNVSGYVTVVDHPVAFRPLPPPGADLELVNAAEPTRAAGIETFARWRREPLTLTAAYEYLRATELDVERGFRRDVPLDPRHAAGLTAVWEEEDDTRLGIEAYYTGRQAIPDDPYRATGRPYVFVDALAQQRFGRLVVFLHGEDLNDVRQGRFDPLLLRSRDAAGRWTTGVWAPLQGRTLNLGVRWKY